MADYLSDQKVLINRLNLNEKEAKEMLKSLNKIVKGTPLAELDQIVTRLTPDLVENLKHFEKLDPENRDLLAEQVKSISKSVKPRD